MKDRQALPYVHTRRVYTSAMKANLLLVTYGSLTDFSQRISRMYEIAIQTNMPKDSVVTLLMRFNSIGQDVEKFL